MTRLIVPEPLEVWKNERTGQRVRVATVREGIVYCTDVTTKKTLPVLPVPLRAFVHRNASFYTREEPKP